MNLLEAPKEGGQGLQVYGRLAPGVSRDEAVAELAALAPRLAAEHPEREGWTSFRVEKFSEPPSDMTFAFLMMLATVLLVFVVACINVANLLLARAAGRSHELAVVSALGASRARIVGKLLAEAVILVAAGAAFLEGVARLHRADRERKQHQGNAGVQGGQLAQELLRGAPGPMLEMRGQTAHHWDFLAHLPPLPVM